MDFNDEDLEEVEYNPEEEEQKLFEETFLPEDEYGHVWDLGWVESEIPHPGFGGSTDICGGYVDECRKCGMYGYEFQSFTEIPGKYQLQKCGNKIR